MAVTMAIHAGAWVHAHPVHAAERADVALEKAMSEGDIQASFPHEFDVPSVPDAPVPVAPTLPPRPELERLRLPWTSLAAILVTMAGLTLLAMAVHYLREHLPAWEPVLDEHGTRPPRYEPAGVTGESSVEEADRLAGLGEFGAAMHQLMLGALRVVSRRSLRPLPSSMTSREVLLRPEVLPQERPVLGALISMVERVWFGQRVPTGEDYATCRRCFHEFSGLAEAP